MARRSSSHHSVSAFTLVELLVVITILAILATLSFTALAKARRTAKKSQCIQNLKQQGVALATFVQTYQVYPLFITPPELQSKYPEHRSMWALAISEGKHIGIGDEPGTYKCPTGFKPKHWASHIGFSSYGYNGDGQVGPNSEGNLGLGGADSSDGFEVRPVPESEVKNPTAMLAIGDGAVGNATLIYDGMSLIARSARPKIRGPDDGRARLANRHDGTLSMLYCDGHVESLTIQKLFHDESQLAHWNRDNSPHPDRLR